jgi:hypothetical protein
MPQIINDFEVFVAAYWRNDLKWLMHISPGILVPGHDLLQPIGGMT